MPLSLGVLGSPSCSPSSVLLSLFHPRISGQKPGLLQSVFEVLIVLKQCLRNSMSNRFSLPAGASSMDIDRHIKLVSSSREIEWLKDDHLTCLPSKIILHRPLIDKEFSFSRFQPYPCDACLSFPCSINRICHVFSPFSPPPYPSPLRGGVGRRPNCP